MFISQKSSIKRDLGCIRKKEKGEMKNGQVSYGRVEPISLKERNRDEKWTRVRGRVEPTSLLEREKGTKVRG